MLDQNTDRMWYVIGAVIVGAAVIFLANGTLPSLFASVTDSFQESAQHAQLVTDGITPLNGSNGVNILGNISDDWLTYQSTNHYGVVISPTYRSLEEWDIKAGDTVTLSGMYRVPDEGSWIRPRLMFTPDTYEPNDVTEQNIVSTINYDGTGRFVLKGVVPSGANYVTVRFNHNRRNGETIRFDVKHVKLERGSLATPY